MLIITSNPIGFIHNEYTKELQDLDKLGYNV